MPNLRSSGRCGPWSSVPEANRRLADIFFFQPDVGHDGDPTVSKSNTQVDAELASLEHAAEQHKEASAAVAGAGGD